METKRQHIGRWIVILSPAVANVEDHQVRVLDCRSDQLSVKSFPQLELARHYFEQLLHLYRCWDRQTA